MLKNLAKRISQKLTPKKNKNKAKRERANEQPVVSSLPSESDIFEEPTEIGELYLSFVERISTMPEQSEKVEPEATEPPCITVQAEVPIISLENLFPEVETVNDQPVPEIDTAEVKPVLETEIEPNQTPTDTTPEPMAEPQAETDLSPTENVALEPVSQGGSLAITMTHALSVIRSPQTSERIKDSMTHDAEALASSVTQQINQPTKEEKVKVLEKRTAVFHVRCTPGEKESLEQQARESGCKDLCSYVRKKLFGSE